MTGGCKKSKNHEASIASTIPKLLSIASASLRRIFTPGFGEFGFAAAGTADQGSDFLDDLPRREALGEIGADHNHQGRLAVLRRSENNDAGTELLPKFVGKGPQAGAVGFGQDLRQHAYPPDLARLRQNARCGRAAPAAF